MLLRTFLALSIAGVFSLPAQDSFTDRNSTGLGANWTSVSCSAPPAADWVVTLGTGMAAGCAGADYAAEYWNADSFNGSGDQYSQIAITKGANGYEGVGVRMSAGPNAYFVTLESGACKIFKWVAGTRTDITSSGSCSVSWTNGHTLYIEATGANPTSIVVKDNGSTIGTASDSDIDSGGAPGVIGYVDSGANSLTWQGSNTGGGGATFPGAIINAPIRCCKGLR